jgi:glycosyltransferase 2 family protein
MKINFSALIKYLFFLALGAFFVWLSVKDIDGESWKKIKYAVAHGRKWVIIPVIFMLVLAHYIRALRWKLLMIPLGYKPSSFNSFAAVMIGYLVNMGVPRLGEVFKCTLLARYEKVKFDKLIGTIIVERAVDIICLLAVFFLAVVLQGDIFGDFMMDSLKKFFHDKTGSLSFTKLIIAGSLFILFIVIFYIILKRFGHIDIIAKIKAVIKNILHGLASVRHLKQKRLFLLHSLLIWSLYLCSTYAGLFALKETESLGLAGAVTVLAIGSIGMIITPNGIGAYPLLIAKLMVLYGLDEKTTGTASGWLLWSAQTFIILIGGLICFALISRYNKKRIPIETA